MIIALFSNHQLSLVRFMPVVKSKIFFGLLKNGNRLGLLENQLVGTYFKEVLGRKHAFDLLTLKFCRESRTMLATQKLKIQ